MTTYTTSPSIAVRMAFWPYWLFIYSEAAIGFTLLLLLSKGAKIDWAAYLVILGIMIGLTAIGTWGIQGFYVVRVSNTEIKGFNSLCFPRIFPWEEVSEIKPLNFLGIKCLRIYSKRHYWALWLPLQISNRKSTCESIASLDEKPRQLLAYLEKA